MASRLSEFTAEEVLSSDATTNKTILLGNIGGEPAVVTVVRAALPPLTPQLPVTDFHLLEQNGIYSWGLAAVEQDAKNHPGAKIDVIFPATETHIAKYRAKPRRMIVETPEMYTAITKPYIETMRGERIAWIHAILHEGAEADDVLYRDDDFVMLPNQKWDRKTPESLNLLSIVMRNDIASIRDLTGEHVPLLKHLKSKISGVIAERWGLEQSQVKLYFHYQPSYYHLHIHATNVNFEQNDFGKSILLDTILDMLEARPQGIAAATLSYVISEGHALYPLLSAAKK